MVTHSIGLFGVSRVKIFRGVMREYGGGSSYDGHVTSVITYGDTGISGL
jgi:hypothetical protein